MAAGSAEIPARREASRRAWGRAALRTLHRDGGHLVVGLTAVYAFSGLAVNHIADWDPNYSSYEQTHELGHALRGDDGAIARKVLAQLGIRERPGEVYREDEATLDISLDRRRLHVWPATGRVVEQGQKSRFLLRAANYLHLNRGKPAWRYIADTYAVILLFLAASGVLMIPAKSGPRARGWLLVALGMAVPIVYVTLS